MHCFILLYSSLLLSVQLCLQCLYGGSHLVHLLHHYRSNESPKLNAVWPPPRVRGQTAFDHPAHQGGVETFRQLNIVDLNNLQMKNTNNQRATCIICCTMLCV